MSYCHIRKLIRPPILSRSSGSSRAFFSPSRDTRCMQINMNSANKYYNLFDYWDCSRLRYQKSGRLGILPLETLSYAQLSRAHLNILVICKLYVPAHYKFGELPGRLAVVAYAHDILRTYQMEGISPTRARAYIHGGLERTY